MRLHTTLLLGLLAGCTGEADTNTDDAALSAGDTASGGDDVDSGGGSDDDDALENRLANPGFEQGETWQISATGYVSREWARTGDGIYQSDATFTALEGERAQKIWGFYSGDVPNSSEHSLPLTDLTPGDTHVFSAHALTHSADGVGGGSYAVLFLRYVDDDGQLLDEAVSAERIDADTPRDEWRPLSVSAQVPEGAASGELGLRFYLADWSATGAVYLDEASWTSTGSGSVTDERLLVWSDEFDGDAIDGDKWTHEILAAYTYNNELQAYTDRAENSRVEGGALIITAEQESYGSANYTSARLNTSGKAQWIYGRFEGRLRVPAGVGTWPALWMLPTDWAYGGWPDSGEIDIMEHVGCDAGVVHGTVHTGAYNHLLGTQRGGSRELSTATEQSHLFAIDWTEERVTFSVDNSVYFTFDNDGAGDPATWPFDQAFHFVVNLAVGGDWGGYCGVDASAFPQTYEIDWIRVYQ